jgi:hypothetical protein
MSATEILTTLGTSEGRADPYPLYAALHEIGEVIEVGPDDVMVVGYDAINSVLRDPGFRVSDESIFDSDLPSWRANPVFVQSADWILNLNAPRHSRVRSLIARAFTARRIAGLEPAIAKMADELLDAMADRGADGSAVEFMHDFAYLLPVTVICELIGIPEADREGFRPIARDLAGVFELNDIATLPAINAAAVELLAYFTGLDRAGHTAGGGKPGSAPIHRPSPVRPDAPRWRTPQLRRRRALLRRRRAGQAGGRGGFPPVAEPVPEDLGRRPAHATGYAPAARLRRAPGDGRLAAAACFPDVKVSLGHSGVPPKALSQR